MGELNYMSIEKRHKLIATIMGICLLVVFAVLIFQMARIQIFGHDKYKKLAEKQQSDTIELPARRGPILDRNGKILADSMRVHSVFADPLFIKDKHETASKLSEVLDLDPLKVSDLINKKRRFVWIKRRLSEVEWIAIERLKLKGIHSRFEYKRVYPNNELLSHVIGITDIDGNGIEGIEKVYDEILKGESGFHEVEKDGLRRQIININNASVQPRDGSGVRLTIDKVVQQYVEEEVEAAFVSRTPQSIMAVVMKTSTGEILAMANRPTFNPNNFSKYPASVRRNRSITDCYEPGSIMKPLIVGALFNHSLVSPDDEIFCHNGTYRMGRRLLHDSHPYGNLTVANVVVKSSNIGMAQLAAKLDTKTLHSYLSSMQFGAKFNINLPGQTNGILRPLSTWTSYSVASIAMGHEIAVTPLQFVNAFCSIANGGKLLQPTIVKAIVTNDGEKVEKEFNVPVVIREVMTRSVACDMLTPILVNVVNNGTGKKAQLDDYQVAGKTGTAQKMDGKVYSHEKYVGSFVAYAPAESPEICVLVMVDEPKGAYYGGTVAAPIVKNILKRALDYHNGLVPESQMKLASLLEN